MNFLRNYDGITWFYDEIGLLTSQDILIAYEKDSFFAITAPVTQRNFILGSKWSKTSCQRDSLEKSSSGSDYLFALPLDFSENINSIAIDLMDNDCHLCRFFIEGLEFFSHCLSKLCSALPSRLHIADEGKRNFAVRTHRHHPGQIRIFPHLHLYTVLRANYINLSR